MKIRSGKLTVLGSSIQYVVDEMQAQRMTTLPVNLAHLYRHEHLDPIHRDPFDRMIIAQALAEQVPIVTYDRSFPQYGVEILW